MMQFPKPEPFRPGDQGWVVNRPDGELWGEVLRVYKAGDGTIWLDVAVGIDIMMVPISDGCRVAYGHVTTVDISGCFAQSRCLACGQVVEVPTRTLGDRIAENDEGDDA
jgi:hypothetical protein